MLTKNFLNPGSLRNVSLGGALVLALAAGACAKTKAPQGQLTQAHASIRAAEEQKATDVPKANLHLQMAKENVERAEKLINEGNNEEACFVLLRAQSDAELSLALAKESSLAKEAQDVAAKVQEMKPAAAGQAAPAAQPKKP